MTIWCKHVHRLELQKFLITKGDHFEFDQVEIFQDASSPEISHFVL